MGPDAPLQQPLLRQWQKNYPVEQAIKLAIDFVQAAISMGEQINPYVGHVWHGAYTHGEKRLEYSDEK
jgi:pyridoxine kinase